MLAKTFSPAFTTARQHIACKLISPKTAQVVFEPEFQTPCTVVTDKPVTSGGKHAFEVLMPIKEGHTAFGFVASPARTAYMTPDYDDEDTHKPAGPYVSMGGAGFIYPLRQLTTGQYKVNDVVRVELNVDDQGKGAIQFSVNGNVAGSVPWEHGLPAYPAISCKSGHVVCDLTWLE